MPGFDGTGPRNRPGRGRGLAQRHGRAQVGATDRSDDGAALPGSHIYEYTLEELRQRKKAMEQEISWIEDRIRELLGQSDNPPQTEK